MSIATMSLPRQAEDTTTAVEFGRTVGLELPVLQVVDRLFGNMVAHGDGDLDHSAIFARSAGETA